MRRSLTRESRGLIEMSRASPGVRIVLDRNGRILIWVRRVQASAEERRVLDEDHRLPGEHGVQRDEADRLLEQDVLTDREECAIVVPHGAIVRASNGRR
jgi:hypothetical protein